MSLPRVRYWDMAASIGGDYTCGVRMSKRDGIFYVEDVVRGRWTPHERDNIILQTAALDAGTFGGNTAVAIYIEQEPGSSGVSTADYLTKLLVGYLIKRDKPTGDKTLRAMPFAAQCEAGNVFLVDGGWNSAYLDELTSFPNGLHDDQVDGSSGAFNKLAIGFISATSLVDFA